MADTGSKTPAPVPAKGPAVPKLAPTKPLPAAIAASGGKPRAARTGSKAMPSMPVVASVPAMPETPVVAEPAAAVIPVAPVRTTIVETSQEEAKMETITNPTDTMQAMFAGSNDTAKGAMEKGAKMFEDMTAFGKGNIEAIVESSKIAANAAQTLGQDAAEYAKTSYESATAAMKTLAGVKSPTEFMKLQGDYMRTAFDAMVAETSRSTERMLKIAGEVAQPISNRVAIATEKMKIAA